MPSSAAVLLCLVIGVSDGDTITARCETPQGTQNIKVRMAEIDAPEKAQPWGKYRHGSGVPLLGRIAAALRVRELSERGSPSVSYESSPGGAVGSHES